ncbi:MAG: hypothetical protein EHM93_08255 [Bacteroidales bacterium]|nr:MAG: hypothetical protein EHM93_08255 [Bacteroidales bacterium]
MNSYDFTLAMFPLQTFLLPGEEIPLRIFEPRYIELIEDCKKTGMRFGIPYTTSDEITSYGCEVELQSIVAKNSLNEMVVLIKCVRNFHLLDFFDELPNKLYSGGVVEYVDDDFNTNNPELIVLVKKLKLEINSINGAIATHSSFKLFDIAKSLLLKSEDKYKLYSLRNHLRMEKFLIKQLKFYELVKNNEDALQKNFSLN